MEFSLDLKQVLKKDLRKAITKVKKMVKRRVILKDFIKVMKMPLMMLSKLLVSK